MRLAVGIAAALLGVWLLLRFLKSREAAALQAQSTPPSTYRTDKSVAAPPSGSALDRARTVVNDVNEAGCAEAAKRVGLGGYGTPGCGIFLKYLTPVGQVQVVYDNVKAPIAKGATYAYNNTLGRIF